MTARLSGALLLAVALAAGTACSDPGLGVADLGNIQDTLTLGALNGSSLQLPSAFSITEALAVHTDKASGFDFVYDVLPDNRRVFMPLAAIGMAIQGGTNPGLQRYDGTFESIVSAPSSGYSTTDTLSLAVGDVVIARSRVVCYLSVPQYAKFKILSFDDAAKTVRFVVLDGINCGYRNLQPGVPEN